MNEFPHTVNIGTPNDFKVSAGVKNDPRTHVGVKIEPRNPFHIVQSSHTILFLGTLSKVKIKRPQRALKVDNFVIDWIYLLFVVLRFLNRF